MSHILVIGAGAAGLAAAIRLAEHGQRVTLAAPHPPIHNRAAGLSEIELDIDAMETMRQLGAQDLSGHEILHALSRRLLSFEVSGHVRTLFHHRLLRLAVSDGVCMGGALLDEYTGTIEGIAADAVVLATGGCLNMFTPSRHCDGAAAALAFQAGAALRDIDREPVSGAFLVTTGGLAVNADGATTLTGLFAAGEAVVNASPDHPFAQSLARGTAVADYISEILPEADPAKAEHAAAQAADAMEQLADLFRRTKGARGPAAVERRIRESVQRTLIGERSAALLSRSLLDIKVMRQQAGRGGYDLALGMYETLRLPALLTLLEAMLTTAAYRLAVSDGELTASLNDGNIFISCKKEA